jgi:hypothetical protein
MATVHLIKLCVGAETVEELAAWQAGRGGRPSHVTRLWPRRAEDLLAGGSLYWVMKGQVLCRQRILALDTRVDEAGVRRCVIGLDAAIVRTRPQPRRPFQGWRYLSPEDAPRDLAAEAAGGEALPARLAAELASLGVL